MTLLIFVYAKAGDKKSEEKRLFTGQYLKRVLK